MKKLLRIGKYKKLKKKNDMANKESTKEEYIEEEIPTSIKIVKEKLRAIFSEASDFVIKEILMKDNQTKILIAYIDGMIDSRILNQDIILPIINAKEELLENFDKGNKDLFTHIKYNVLNACESEDTKDFKASITDILAGDSILYMQGQSIAIKLCTKGGWEQRGVEQPETETVVRGPREGFTESLRVNTSMLRRKIKNPKLKFEPMKIGEQTNTDVCICYIKGIANTTIVDSVKDRLSKIKIDAILESGYLEQFIEDHPYSIFSTVGNSEKPDMVAAKLLEGRVAILCDGTPFVLTVPHLFIENLQSSGDYYSRPYFASMARLLRIMAIIITAMSPALYVALLSFHLESVPERLLLSIVASRARVPFTSFIEATFMILTFELLREAGVRMPKAVGSAISIVGALVLGDSAVKAGIASDILIVVVAITAITSFIVTSLLDVTIFIRFSLLVGAEVLGIMGMTLVIFILAAHMCSLRSFGVPYMSPLAPIGTEDLKDTYIRVPFRWMKTRPRSIIWGNKDTVLYRQEVNRKED